ncbi:serine hydrolase domain-containing protein [Hymenobacter terricola]|uniref:serine hydrolase domain-containing protein n=1 Tax=Hymenobacter terricola TaxID=2819236 RepID=UPI001B31739E|nr:serine hydrolase domain-containing protein [Hymenobacter terricola]
MLKNLLLAALLAVLLAVPAVAQPGVPVIHSLAQLQDSLRHVMAREHIPGLMLTLVSHDSVLFEGGLGLADIAAQRPVTAHTRFRIGSVTKTFVVAGLLQLIEQGKLNLNDEVHKIAPEIPIDNPWEATDPVRVVHLLEHTAGFDDMRLNHVYNPTPTDPRGPAALAVFRGELRCRWRPGERMSYSNPGYEVAGYLLEKLSGQAYEQYLTTHLLRPLAMPDATPALRIIPGPGMSQGHKFADGHYQAVPLLPIYAGPAGSMSASAADMTQWVKFFLHDGRTPDGTALLQPASLHEMETAHSPLSDRTGLHDGYGLANFALGLKGKVPFRGHSGGIDGFITAFGYNRELGVGYSFSNNGGVRAPKLEQLVQAFLLRQLPTPTPPARVPLDVAAVAPYLGHYRSAAPRNEMAGFADYLVGGTNLRRQGNFLLNEPLIGEADTLLPTGPLTFRRPAEQTATAVLTHDKEGRQVLITSSEYALAAGFWWWLPPALLALCGLLVLTSSLAALVGLVQVLRRKIPRVQLLPRLLPLLAASALMVTLAALFSLGEHIWTAGQVNLPTVLFSLGPLVFVACTVAGFLLTVRYFGHFRRRAVAWYLLLTYGALGWLAAVLATYGWLGLRVWSV